MGPCRFLSWNGGLEESVPLVPMRSGTIIQMKILRIDTEAAHLVSQAHGVGGSRGLVLNNTRTVKIARVARVARREMVWRNRRHHIRIHPNGSPQEAK